MIPLYVEPTLNFGLKVGIGWECLLGNRYFALNQEFVRRQINEVIYLQDSGKTVKIRDHLDDLIFLVIDYQFDVIHDAQFQLHEAHQAQE